MGAHSRPFVAWPEGEANAQLLAMAAWLATPVVKMKCGTGLIRLESRAAVEHIPFKPPGDASFGCAEIYRALGLFRTVFVYPTGSLNY